MGNTVNGILMWDMLLQKYEGIIRKSFTLHERFIQMANKKMHNIRKAFLKSLNTSTCQANEKMRKREGKLPELIYVGIHVR